MISSQLTFLASKLLWFPALLGQANSAGTTKDLVDMSREARKTPVSSVQQYLVLLAAIALLCLLLLGLILFQRRRKLRRRQMLHRSPWPASASKNQGMVGKLSRGRRRKRRHQRPMNPTLAQTGGLPPVRPLDEPPTA